MTTIKLSRKLQLETRSTLAPKIWTKGAAPMHPEKTDPSSHTSEPWERTAGAESPTKEHPTKDTEAPGPQRTTEALPPSAPISSVAPLMLWLDPPKNCTPRTSSDGEGSSREESSGNEPTERRTSPSAVRLKGQPVLTGKQACSVFVQATGRRKEGDSSCLRVEKGGREAESDTGPGAASGEWRWAKERPVHTVVRPAGESTGGRKTGRKGRGRERPLEPRKLQSTQRAGLGREGGAARKKEAQWARGRTLARRGQAQGRKEGKEEDGDEKVACSQ